jgi:hypothetical protein
MSAIVATTQEARVSIERVSLLCVVNPCTRRGEEPYGASAPSCYSLAKRGEEGK